MMTLLGTSRVDDAALAVVWTLAIGLPIGTVTSAIFLRVAITLYNNLAGGESSPRNVPDPTAGKILWISFAVCLAHMFLTLIFYAVARELVVRLLISIPVSVLVTAGIVAAKLPTSFGRAILVVLCSLAPATLAVGIIVVIAMMLKGT